jgi:hypothetical protein
MLFNNIFPDRDFFIGLNDQGEGVVLKIIAARKGKKVPNDNPIIRGASWQRLPSGQIVVKDENGSIVYMTN